MTKEERQDRSRLRAEEHARRNRMRLILLITSLALYVLVPLLWYGAVEFGWVHPIQTPEFKQAINLASVALLLVILFFLPEFFLKRNQEQKREDRPKQVKTLTESDAN